MRRRSPSRLMPYLVLIVGLLLTFVAGSVVQRSTDAREQLRFQNEVQHARKSVQDRLDIYISLLRATAGLFAAHPDVDADDFARYTRRLWLNRNYAGVQGIGYTAKVNPREAAAFEERMRREGVAGFHLWSNSPAPELHAITYLEPMDERNRKAIGFNMYSEPLRRAAMERARDTGMPTASGSVHLVQEFAEDPDPQRGFLIYVPIYRTRLAPGSTVAERRKALMGFAYSPFRTADLMKGIFPEGAPSPHIHFDVYDSETQTPHHLLYQSTRPHQRRARFTETATVDAGNREWTMVFASEPAFDRGAARGVVPSTFLGGAIFSVLVFGLLLSQMRSREAAERSADDLGRSVAAREEAERLVRESERELRRLYEEAREARGEAEKANRLKDDFLATVSHELRTPLNAIMGYSQLLGMGGRTAEQTQRALQSIERNVKAQAQLIDDLLDVSRIVSGKLRLDLAPVDVAAVVRNAVESISPDAAAKGIMLRVDSEPGIATVRADEGRLQQVVWNLLSNAIKFTPANGQVSIAVSRVGSNARIAVADSGRGIAPEALDHIFDRFRQADGSTTRRYGGLGLGLSIVSEIVAMHGGSVRAESDGPEQGARFTVTLPLAADAEPPVVRGEGEGHASVPLEGLRLLVVDDDVDARTVLREILEDAGARVAAAASAEEALRAIARSVPHVLVSDIGMPGEDGYALIRRVRALSPERGGAVPALALTAFNQPEDRTRAMEAGFHRHVAKPVAPRALIALVAALAEGGRR